MKKGITYDDIRNVILSDGVIAFFDRMQELTEAYREIKRAEAEISEIKTFNSLLLTKLEYLTVLQVGLFAIRDVIDKAFDLNKETLNAVFCKYQYEVIKFHK